MCWHKWGKWQDPTSLWKALSMKPNGELVSACLFDEYQIRICDKCGKIKKRIVK